MAKKRGFMGIDKHSPNTKKNALSLLLFAVIGIVVGYFIFIGFKV